jgi:hypothetical protein
MKKLLIFVGALAALLSLQYLGVTTHSANLAGTGECAVPSEALSTCMIGEIFDGVVTSIPGTGTRGGGGGIRISPVAESLLL